jgi:outer membrane protein OmpA-like peptidoglycan-associated protein
MLIAALCAFAAAATAGLFLAFRHFTRKKLPASIALLHGLGGATGFLLVLLVVVQDPDFRLARQALYLFMVTILLGAVNLLFHLRKKRHRTSLIVLHAAVAVSGVLTLVVAIFSGESNATAQPVATQAPVVAPAPSAAAVDVAPKVAEPSASAAPAPAASAPAVTEPAAPASAKELAVDASVRDALGQAIRFETKSTAIAAESQSAVADIAKALKDHPEVVIVEVQGHADERGDDAQNVALTQGRAAAVVEALVGRGVERARLHAAGYGARCPADDACRSASAPDSCHSPDRYASDRRVVFVPLRVGTTSLAGDVVCARGAELIPPADRAFHVP